MYVYNYLLMYHNHNALKSILTEVLHIIPFLNPFYLLKWAPGTLGQVRAHFKLTHGPFPAPTQLYIPIQTPKPQEIPKTPPLALLIAMATPNSKKKKSKKSGGFQSMGLIPTVFRGVMNKGYKVPTKIQRKAIPQILAGFDVVAMAPTGSGKTAAFIVPMLQRLRQHLPGAGVRALVLSPTRDLAIQTLKFVKQLGKFTG